MRIGMILDKTFPPDPRVENEAIELIKAGHEVFLFCLTYGNELKEEVINKIKVKRYQSNKFEYKLSALAYTFPLYTFFMKKKIQKFLINFKIESIHIHDMVVAEAVFNANKKNNLPLVLDLHENRPEIMRFYPHLKKFPANILISLKKWKQKEEQFINKTDKLIVITQEAKEDVLNRCTIDKEHIVLVPNTVRKSFYSGFELGKKETKEFNLLYIGDTGERRGLKTAVESLVDLSKEIKDIKLTIVGKVTIELKSLVTKLNLESYVSFEGWQNEDTFQKYINESSVCLSPLHRNIHHDTTYANKIFQYMSMGKPLLVSDATAQKNMIQKSKSGLVYEAKNTIDFTNKILDLYKDKSLRSRLGENGKSFVRNEFTWDKTSKDLIELYNNLQIEN